MSENKNDYIVDFRYPPSEIDDENGFIICADIYDNQKNKICILSVGPQLFQDGWNMKWTGNAELCYCAAESEEFDVILISGDIEKGNDNDEFARKLIIDNIPLAISIPELAEDQAGHCPENPRGNTK